MPDGPGEALGAGAGAGAVLGAAAGAVWRAGEGLRRGAGAVVSGPAAEVVSIAVLVGVLAFAVVRPRGLPEVVVALPGAVLLLAVGAVSPDHARDEVTRLAPVVAFLAAVLVLARLCDSEGLFRAFGSRLSHAARGSSVRLLAAVFVLASLTTAALSLDATVVLFTPVVFATAARLGVRAKPHLYACAHLSNTASVLFPVSNLTNLLAFAGSGLGFARFSLLMTPPWLVSIGAEYLVFRRFFAAELAAPATGAARDPAVAMPRVALGVVAGTLTACAGASVVGIDPAWAAFAGAGLLGVHALRGRRTTLRRVLSATSPSFLVFVLGLAVVVRAVVDHGLGSALGRVLPTGGAGLVQLLVLAAVAAVLANLINNLPAVLVLLPLVVAAGPAAVLAVLLGVNLGPNLTYPGSLATLLWRRVLAEHDRQVDLREFTRLGLLTVPLTLVLAVGSLWLTVSWLGA